MIRQLMYMAAPLRPTEDELRSVPLFDLHGRVPASDRVIYSRAIDANIDRAMCWLAWLRRSFPETTFIAPWIVSVLAGADDTDPAQREAGIADDCAVIERCDGIVLVGLRISEGMRREMEHGRQHAGIDWEVVKMGGAGVLGAREFEVYDLTPRLIAPPHPEAPGGARGRTFVKWFDEVIRS